MGLRDSQLVEHTLHLLVDAEGCALLLIPIGLAGPVTLRQGGVLDGSLALPLPPPHGWDLNGRQVQRLQRRGRVHEEKGRVGRAGRRSGNQQKGGVDRERRYSYNDRNRNTRVTKGQADRHRRDRTADPEERKRNRKQSSEIGEKRLVAPLRCIQRLTRIFFFFLKKENFFPMK